LEWREITVNSLQSPLHEQPWAELQSHSNLERLNLKPTPMITNRINGKILCHRCGTGWHDPKYGQCFGCAPYSKEKKTMARGCPKHERPAPAICSCCQANWELFFAKELKAAQEWRESLMRRPLKSKRQYL
jgi:hypothetical protein